MTHDADATLLKGLQTGDETAIHEMVRTYHRELFVFAVRYLRSEADAEEVVQDAFIRAFKHGPKFRGDCSVKSWLYRITTNLCLNHIRKLKREHVTDEPPEVSQQATGLQDLLDAERLEILRDTVESLPPKQRMVLQMRVYEDLSLKEIAERLDAPLGTVKANLFHATKNLKKQLAPLFIDDEESS